MFSETTNLIMQFFAIAKKVEGRIKLQKVIYILQSKGLIDFDLDYKYALYGPYSQDLQLEIDYLTKIGFLRETISNNYVYEVNTDFPIDVEIEENVNINKLFINDLLNEESQLLEVTSTIYYLKSYHYKNAEDIEEKIKLLKPNLKNKIKSAFELYSELEKYSN
jgi:uncharacterized protein YwgA